MKYLFYFAFGAALLYIGYGVLTLFGVLWITLFPHWANLGMLGLEDYEEAKDRSFRYRRSYKHWLRARREARLGGYELRPIEDDLPLPAP